MEHEIGFGLVMLSQAINHIHTMDKFYSLYEGGGRSLNEIDIDLDQSYRFALATKLKEFNQLAGENIVAGDAFEAYDQVFGEEVLSFDREVIKRESALQVIDKKEAFINTLKQLTKDRIFELLNETNEQFNGLAIHEFPSSQFKAYFQVDIDCKALRTRITDAFIGYSPEARDEELSKEYEHMIDLEF